MKMNFLIEHKLINNRDGFLIPIKDKIIIPIIKVNDFNVICYFKEIDSEIIFTMETTDIIDEELNNHELFTTSFKKTIDTHLMNHQLNFIFENIFPYLKLNKLHSSLVFDDCDIEEEINLVKELHEKFLNCENVKIEYEKCPICFDYCGYKLKCRHHCCIECLKNIKLNEGNKLCPLCREII
jgi:hypothetical protein